MSKRIGKKKLTDDDVRNIRALYIDGLTMKQIADKFEVTAPHVWRIVHGEQGGEHGNCPFCGQRLPDNGEAAR